MQDLGPYPVSVRDDTYEAFVGWHGCFYFTVRTIKDHEHVDDLAEKTHKPRNTVYKWRATGTGPEGMRVGRSILFWECSVLWWLKGLEDQI
jgi:hypothetical protein